MGWPKILGGAVAATIGVASVSVAEAEIIHVTLTATEVDGAYEPVSDDLLTVTFSYDTAAEGVYDDGVMTERYLFLSLQIERFGDTLDFAPGAPFTTTLDPVTGTPAVSSIFISQPVVGNEEADALNLFAQSRSILGDVNLIMAVTGPDGALSGAHPPTLEEMIALAAGEVPAVGEGSPLASGIVAIEFDEEVTFFFFNADDVTVVPEPTAALALLVPLALARRRRPVR